MIKWPSPKKLLMILALATSFLHGWASYFSGHQSLYGAYSAAFFAGYLVIEAVGRLSLRVTVDTLKERRTAERQRQHIERLEDHIRRYRHHPRLPDDQLEAVRQKHIDYLLKGMGRHAD